MSKLDDHLDKCKRERDIYARLHNDLCDDQKSIELAVFHHSKEPDCNHDGFSFLKITAKFNDGKIKLLSGLVEMSDKYIKMIEDCYELPDKKEN
jgi:hypothetical protein